MLHLLNDFVTHAVSFTQENLFRYGVSPELNTDWRKSIKLSVRSPVWILILTPLVNTGLSLADNIILHKKRRPAGERLLSCKFELCFMQLF